MKLRFALAVNKDHVFEKRHFGDADKYLIYESHNDILILVDELKNSLKNFDENKHDSQKKGIAISKLLIEKGVNIIVSKQFGTNITEVNKHFIPIVICFETLESVVNALSDKLQWIAEEVNRKTDNHKLFKIKSGIIKMDIN